MEMPPPFLCYRLSLSLSLSLSLKNFVSAAGLDTKYFKFLRVSKICNKSASYLINSNFNTFVILLIRVVIKFFVEKFPSNRILPFLLEILQFDIRQEKGKKKFETQVPFLHIFAVVNLPIVLLIRILILLLSC